MGFNAIVVAADASLNATGSVAGLGLAAALVSEQNYGAITKMYEAKIFEVRNYGFRASPLEAELDAIVAGMRYAKNIPFPAAPVIILTDSLPAKIAIAKAWRWGIQVPDETSPRDKLRKKLLENFFHNLTRDPVMHIREAVWSIRGHQLVEDWDAAFVSFCNENTYVSPGLFATFRSLNADADAVAKYAKKSAEKWKSPAV